MDQDNTLHIDDALSATVNATEPDASIQNDPDTNPFDTAITENNDGLQSAEIKEFDDTIESIDHAQTSDESNNAMLNILEGCNTRNAKEVFATYYSPEKLFFEQSYNHTFEINRINRNLMQFDGYKLAKPDISIIEKRSSLDEETILNYIFY